MTDQYDTPYTVTMNPLPMAHSMTLRDWFAGQALAGLLPSAVTGLIPLEAWEQTLNGAAANAYGVADAMLKAREVQS
jgi:hypothetical protein